MGTKQRITRKQGEAILRDMERMAAAAFMPHLRDEDSSVVEGMLQVTFYDDNRKPLHTREYGTTGREWRNGQWV